MSPRPRPPTTRFSRPTACPRTAAYEARAPPTGRPIERSAFNVQRSTFNRSPTKPPVRLHLQARVPPRPPPPRPPRTSRPVRRGRGRGAQPLGGVGRHARSHLQGLRLFPTLDQ